MKIKIGVVGLGYVGLPLAVAASTAFKTIGFDINERRVAELSKGQDYTGEINSDDLSMAQNLSFTSSSSDLKNINFYIIAVPTPVDKLNKPDLTPLIRASELLGAVISKGDYVVFESTVYPGATEEDCIPVIEKYSGLTAGRDFFFGYSPERINPGDKVHRLTDIKKIVSGCSSKSLSVIADVYRKFIKAGVHEASSIKVAEAAKVVENIQRDTNIALMNELSQIFNVLKIDTKEVIEAASTKWNFMRYTPGLVGGHCISVDPYYLTHKAVNHGYIPDIIMTSRKINEAMSSYLGEKIISLMVKKKINFSSARVLIAGFSFKEDCPDIRNTKIADLVKHLKDEFDISIDIYDPLVDSDEVFNSYGLRLTEELPLNTYDCLVLAVPHAKLLEKNCSILKGACKDKCIIIDVKSALKITDSDFRL